MTTQPKPTNPKQRLRAQASAQRLHIVLVEPEIPPNTGNIARLCAATQSPLHLVHPLGFSVSEKAVRRAGLDYWPLVDVHEHASFEEFLATDLAQGRKFFLSGKAETSYLDVQFQDGDLLIFGKESTGLSGEIHERFAKHLIGIPTRGPVRSLNLANAVSICLYEGLRQLDSLSNPQLG